MPLQPKVFKASFRGQNYSHSEADQRPGDRVLLKVDPDKGTAIGVIVFPAGAVVSDRQ